MSKRKTSISAFYGNPCIGKQEVYNHGPEVRLD
jgi:hypothetical protein